MATHEAIGLLTFSVASVAALVLWLLMHRRATRLAACRWRKRPPMGNDEFLAACNITDEPLRIEVALAARRVIGELATVPAETIRPDDSFAHDLVQLPYWDSLDWLDFVFLVEREIRLKVSRSLFDEAAMLDGGWTGDLRVKHVIRAVSMAAIQSPNSKAFY
jgi:acyl carrier protein